MKVGVVGCGYVGTVVAACLAETGNQVAAADIDAARIDSLRAAKSPIFEPGLDELLEKNLAAGRLRFSASTADAGGRAEVVFLCVGTPMMGDGRPELGPLFDAARSIAASLEGPSIVAVKSTVPVGTTERLAAETAPLARVPVEWAFVPEFLKEGDAVRDLTRPDRVVVGASKPEVVDTLRRLHAPFLRTMHPFIPMDVRSAEMTKYASNFMLASRISAINEIAALCERTGADVEAVRRGVGADSRIGYPFLFPGIGYGGSCFPKDVEALIRLGEDHGLEMAVASAVQRTNREQRARFAARVLERLGGGAGRTIAVWGLAFKPRTDDMREAPAVSVIEALLGAGAKVQAYDPKANRKASNHFGSRITVAKDPYSALDDADALLLLTEWDEFRAPDFEEIRRRMRSPVVFDGRNIWDRALLRGMGFDAFGVGRP
jgi:UDPglucose 6-dehydrogenase